MYETHLLFVPHVLSCNNVNRTMQQLAPFTLLGVTSDRAWETLYIYPTIIWNIIGMVHFIKTNNTFNVCVYRNNASNIIVHKTWL